MLEARAEQETTSEMGSALGPSTRHGFELPLLIAATVAVAAGTAGSLAYQAALGRLDTIALTGLGAAGLCAVGLCTWMAGRCIQSPLRRLREAVAQLQAGEDVAVAGIERGDAIGDLARSLKSLHESG